MSNSKLYIYILVFSILLCGSNLSAQSNSINQYVENAIGNNPALKGAIVSVKAVWADNGETICAINENNNLIPASCLKMVTLAAGMLDLGGDYTFQNVVAIDGSIENGILNGNLIIHGGGDPSFGSDEISKNNADSILALISNALIARNIKTIRGRIITDVTIYSDSPIVESWLWEDIGNGYGASPRGLNWKDNSFSISINAGNTIGSKAIITSQPNFPDSETINNKVVTVSNQGENLVNFFSTPTKNAGYDMEGTIIAGTKNYRINAATSRPELWFSQDLTKYLSQHGITCMEDIIIPPNPTTEDTILIIKSQTFNKIAKHTSEKSINLYAESILKQLGWVVYQNGTYENGVKAIKEMLHSLEIDTNNIKIVDGSGLSRKNMLSTNFICTFLQKMLNSSMFESYLKIWPQAGAKNLTSFLANSPQQRNLYAKSGSMSGVCNYCGYFRHSSGRWIVFSSIVNNSMSKTRDIRPFHEQFVKQLSLL